MSIKRYYPEMTPWLNFKETEQGTWCKWEDVQQLQEENEELKQIKKEQSTALMQSIDRGNKLQKENEELKFRCADLHHRIQEHNTAETKRTDGKKRFIETPLSSKLTTLKEGNDYETD